MNWPGVVTSILTAAYSYERRKWKSCLHWYWRNFVSSKFVSHMNTPCSIYASSSYKVFILDKVRSQPTRSNCTNCWKVWHGCRSCLRQCKHLPDTSFHPSWVIIIRYGTSCMSELVNWLFWCTTFERLYMHVYIHTSTSTTYFLVWQPKCLKNPSDFW